MNLFVSKHADVAGGQVVSEHGVVTAVSDDGAAEEG